MSYINSVYNAACPICSNTKNRLLYKVSSKEAAIHFLVTHWLDKSHLDKIDNKIAALWNKKTAAVVACNSCRFVFADPFVAGDHEFYNLLPHAKDETAEDWKWEFDITYKTIAGLIANNKDLKVLEIGASTGGFVKRLAQIIPKENIFCLEHSEIGVHSITKAGIEAYTWNFHEMQHKPGFAQKFDIVCLFQVLEHLDALADTFKTLHFVTKPHGHLFIGVPNGNKIKFNELNGALLDMPPNHIGRYNKTSFEYLGNRHGWNIDEIMVETYTPMDVMKTVMYYRSLKERQLPPVKITKWYCVKQYLQIKYIRLQSFLMYKKLGETLWVHYVKQTE
jgi:2-polyprenyl-3-methyl-5-hydroxy-6-metoxy-1,4-benzoquinol methylase